MTFQMVNKCFFKKKKKKIIHVKNTGQLDPTYKLIDPNLFLTYLKWPIFDPQPDWPNLTHPFFHVKAYPFRSLLFFTLIKIFHFT